MSKRSRTRAHRRDRRKAKASDWRREGKSNMGSRVGHGTSGSPGQARRIQGKMITPSHINKPIKFSNPSIATIGEILKSKSIEIPKIAPPERIMINKDILLIRIIQILSGVLVAVAGAIIGNWITAIAFTLAVGIETHRLINNYHYPVMDKFWIGFFIVALGWCLAALNNLLDSGNFGVSGYILIGFIINSSTMILDYKGGRYKYVKEKESEPTP